MDAPAHTVELVCKGGALGGALTFTALEIIEGGTEAHHVISEHPSLRITNHGLNCLSFTGNLCLPTERRQLATNLPGEIVEPRQVRLHGFELALGLFFATTVLEDSRRLLDKAAAIFRARMEHLIELALAHDDVHFPAQATIAQKLLNIE